MRRALCCLIAFWLVLPCFGDDPTDLEADVINVVAQAKDATVAIHLGGGTGSGVIVSPDGLVLSVAHVTGSLGQRAAVYFADGSVAAAETLGLEPGTDCGMLRLLGGGPWPFVALADAENENVTPTLDQPVVALGHPGGFDATRPVVARLGTILEVDPDDGTLRTDATLSSGDSGGPLLNRHGEVLAIHARVGPALDANYHIAVARFLEQWSKLLEGGAPTAHLGAVGRDALAGFVVGSVEPGSTAERAGLIRGDVIVGFNGVKIGRPPQGRSLRSFLALRRPGDDVELRITRRGQAMQLTVTLDPPR
ncbi:MAG: trypsin-like peptidase domain-containing protein [Planctomycetota bacterium]